MAGGWREERLKQWAVEEGFDRAGVAGLEPSSDGEALRHWLARGDHADMAYLERRLDDRLRPARLLEGARSVLCVALQYYPSRDDGDGSTGDAWPRVARYARGDDYHDFMAAGLERLGARIAEAFPGTTWRRYVDTGPLLERELAARAGIGAVGKNTNLLHPEAGSWFLLGELLLSLELRADDPLADPCGSCTRCLEACPTGALPEAYRLDSRRCISYWTIERRGPVPETLRRQVGEWLFGCDVCQEVCPWNDAPTVTAGGEFDLPERRAGLDLRAFLELDRSRYLELFRGSPMKRARLEGLRRNAALAMGAAGDRRFVEPLAATLADEDPLVRSHAAWALGEIGGEGARQALAGALPTEANAAARAEIQAAIEACREPPRS